LTGSGHALKYEGTVYEGGDNARQLLAMDRIGGVGMDHDCGHGLVSGVGEAPSASAPLPQAPEGVRILAVAAFEAKEQEPVRIAAHPVTGRLYVLGGRRRCDFA